MNFVLLVTELVIYFLRANELPLCWLQSSDRQRAMSSPVQWGACSGETDSPGSREVDRRANNRPTKIRRECDCAAPATSLQTQTLRRERNSCGAKFPDHNL